MKKWGFILNLPQAKLISYVRLLHTKHGFENWREHTSYSGFARPRAVLEYCEARTSPAKYQSEVDDAEAYLDEQAHRLYPAGKCDVG